MEILLVIIVLIVVVPPDVRVAERYLATQFAFWELGGVQVNVDIPRGELVEQCQEVLSRKRARKALTSGKAAAVTQAIRFLPRAVKRCNRNYRMNNKTS